MQAGRMRERISFQRQSVNVSSGGHAVNTWTTFATVWASVRPGGSGERFIAQGDQELATITHTIRIRHRTDLYPTQRILWGTRELDILSIVDPDGKNHEMILLCRENVAPETITPTYS